jgi:hypothetical protein
MTWKIRKEFEGKTVNKINKPLNQLTQKQIQNLNESLRDTIFVKEIKKKKDVSSKI